VKARLRGVVVKAKEIGSDDLARMYELHSAHYVGVDPDRFRLDLAEKDWVILLRDEQELLAGFSTQKLLTTASAAGSARALFSGDTIIAREHWGTQELVRTWCRFAGGVLVEDRSAPLYWFLISKGHRTYLYLPFFFREYFPRRDTPTPSPLQRLLDTLASAKFGSEYDPATGLITPTCPHDRLKPELDTLDQRTRNPEVAFFRARNPHYAAGIELACLAEISPENMRGAARRELEAGMAAADTLRWDAEREEFRE
jgi:hypothetical protein